MTAVKKAPKPDINNPLLNMLGYHLRRAANTMLAELGKGFASLALNLTEATILMIINANPGLKQVDIGRALDIKSGNLTPLIVALANKGVIDRKPIDGRSLGLYLSSDGQQLLKKVLAIVAENEQWLASDLNDAEQETLIKLLAKIWR